MRSLAEELEHEIEEADDDMTPAYDEHPTLVGKQKTKLPDALQAAIIKKKTGKSPQRENRTMKITKRQLRRIIREEKEKMLSEMNPDGTISADENKARQDLMDHVEMKLNELLDHIINESERIGGGFRGPGIKKQAFRLLADMIHSYR
jgi:ribosome recycling factor